MRADNVRHIGTDRQLFVDAFWISVANGVSRRLHAPRKRETVLERDKPWEHDHVSYMGTMKDGDTLRAYYRCGKFGTTEADPEITAYQESVDGIHWQKPNLGILEYEGSKDNNIVWLGPGANMAPFRDDDPDVPADERYKAVVRTRDLWALASADGLHWRLLQKDPISTDGPFDSFNVSFRDPWREEYVAYTRGKAGTEGSFIGPNGGNGGVRWIRRTTSKDFRNWSPPEDIDAGDTPFEHLYTNSCVAYERAPGTYLMFPSRFVPERKPKPDWPGGSGVSDIVFMSSRDGIHFDRSFMEALIRPGPDQDNWHERGLYLDPGLIETSPTELSMYGSEHWRLPTVRIVRYTFRMDGFVSLHAGYSGGEALTRPFVFEGRQLEINYSTSAVGSVKVEIQDASGNAMPGFSLDDCPAMFADLIDGRVTWKDGGDVSRLAGRRVRLRFTLMDADVYAFKFNR